MLQHKGHSTESLPVPVEQDYVLHLRQPEVKEHSEDGEGTPNEPVCSRAKINVTLAKLIKMMST